jgi:hypothetical protein
MEKELSAVVAGHICLDIIPAMPAIPPVGFKETFLPGRLLEVGAFAPRYTPLIRAVLQAADYLKE